MALGLLALDGCISNPDGILSSAESWAKNAGLAKTGSATVEAMCTELNKLCKNLLNFKVIGFVQVMRQALAFFQSFSINSGSPELDIAAPVLQIIERRDAVNKAQDGTDLLEA